MNFGELVTKAGLLAEQRLFLLGLLLVVAGLAFKIAAFPWQILGARRVSRLACPSHGVSGRRFQGRGVCSAAARALRRVAPRSRRALETVTDGDVGRDHSLRKPVRDSATHLKRLLGYSSIANAGYLLLGVAVLSPAGRIGLLYYLAGYLFTVLAAFSVICVVLRAADVEDIGALAGLNQRSPLLASAMTLAMISLAGIPPLAGFFGKFLLFKAVIEQGPPTTG